MTSTTEPCWTGSITLSSPNCYCTVYHRHKQTPDETTMDRRHSSNEPAPISTHGHWRDFVVPHENVLGVDVFARPRWWMRYQSWVVFFCPRAGSSLVAYRNIDTIRLFTGMRAGTNRKRSCQTSSDFVQILVRGCVLLEMRW
jgi:hypothetical protein